MTMARGYLHDNAAALYDDSSRPARPSRRSPARPAADAGLGAS